MVLKNPHLNIIEFYCHKPKLINMVHMTYLFLRASCKSNQVRGERFYFIYLGLKGDWPYLRKAMGFGYWANQHKEMSLLQQT